MAELTEPEILAEYYDCQIAVKDAIGVEMNYFRAPYASVNDLIYQLIPAPYISSAVNAQGYRFVTVTELFTERGYEIPKATPGPKFVDNKPLN